MLANKFLSTKCSLNMKSISQNPILRLFQTITYNFDEFDRDPKKGLIRNRFQACLLGAVYFISKSNFNDDIVNGFIH